MASHVTPELPLSPSGHWSRLALYAGWLPFFLMLSLFVPQFEDLFTRLQDRGDLPNSTQWLMWLAPTTQAPYFFPVLVLFVWLVKTDQLLLGLHNVDARIGIALIVAAAGMGAVVGVAYALLAPISAPATLG